MSETKKDRIIGRVSLTIIVAAILLVGASAIYVNWPWPEVTSTGTAKVVNTPKDGIFRTGDVVRWETPEVCQPTGRTVATVYAVLEFDTQYGLALSKTKIVERDFVLPDGFPICVPNNPTSAFVDGNLPSGIYRFEVEACAYSSPSQPRCATFPGPSGVKILRIVRGQEVQ